MNTTNAVIDAGIMSDIANQLKCKNSPQAKKAIKAWNDFLDLDLSVTPKAVSDSAFRNARHLLIMCGRQYHLRPTCIQVVIDL